MSDLDLPKEEETIADIRSRHRREERELEGYVRALLKKANKKDRAVMEAKSVQMKFDLMARHREETKRYEEVSFTATLNDSVDTIENQSQSHDTLRSSVEAKKLKAARKRERMRNRDVKREKMKADIACNTGPSLRDTELAIINGHLASDSLVVKEVISDGNCLYRALADQLQFVGVSVEGDVSGDFTFLGLRYRAANYLRSHADEFAPFLGMEPTSKDYKFYCNNVEKDGEWGGQIEIRALSASLRRQIHIYDASTPVIVMGEDNVGNSPLKIAYHRHYFALGEHYNSVKRLLNDTWV